MSSRRVHLVYPHGEWISTPDSIGRELGKRLAARYDVVYHDWNDKGAIDPAPGDVLLGHPHPDPRTVFRTSLERPGWSRRIMMAPFSHRDLRQVAFEDSILRKCDVFLAITGSFWFRTVATSRCSHWQPKMIQLEHAVDPADFPRLKTTFAEPGKRRFVYVGHTGRGKGTDYLDEIAGRLPGVEFAHVGPGKPLRHVRSLGFQDFRTESGRRLIEGFDFLITTGNADANPTTVLEAMAWGLIPVCTPTSGYESASGVVNVPAGDVSGAVQVIERLERTDQGELLAIQEANWKRIDDYYNWDRVAADVVAAIESDASPALLPEPPLRRLVFLYYDLTSPYGPIAAGLPGRAVAKLRRIASRGRSVRR